MYGHPAEMDAITAIAARHGLAVIEDACLSLGATYKGRPTGLIGSAGCFSFGIGKVIGGGGDGGMVVTRDAAVAREAKLLRGVGQDPEPSELPQAERLRLHGQQNVREGHFVYLSDLQAAIVRLKLPHVAEWQAERQAVADRYARHFHGTPVKTPVIRPGCTHAWREYVVLVPGRDHVRRALADRGIATALRYIPPVYLQPVYRHLGLGPGTCPVAEHAADRLLAVPMYAGLLPEQVDEIAETVLTAVAQTAA
jgi:dTDP-3-amino-3,4,6-trideoxy-alpha-D-glucose transaminase